MTIYTANHLAQLVVSIRPLCGKSQVQSSVQINTQRLEEKVLRLLSDICK